MSNPETVVRCIIQFYFLRRICSRGWKSFYYIIIPINNLLWQFLYFLHTWCICRLFNGSFTNQTVLWSFVQIHFFWTVSTWCCEIKRNMCDNYNSCAQYCSKIIYIYIYFTWCVARFIHSMLNTKTVLRRIIQSYFFRRICSRCCVKIILLYYYVYKRLTLAIFAALTHLAYLRVFRRILCQSNCIVDLCLNSLFQDCKYLVLWETKYMQ